MKMYSNRIRLPQFYGTLPALKMKSQPPCINVLLKGMIYLSRKDILFTLIIAYLIPSRGAQENSTVRIQSFKFSATTEIEKRKYLQLSNLKWIDFEKETDVNDNALAASKSLSNSMFPILSKLKFLLELPL